MAPLLEMRGIGKSFPGVRALSDVSLTLRAGEVLVLVGENGAGKSTLMRILAGALQADEGEIYVDGVGARIDTPQEAAAPRHRDDLPRVHARATVDSPRKHRSRCRTDARRAYRRRRASQGARRASWTNSRIELPFDVPVSRLSVGQQQLVEIAKALAMSARIIVMDEPTAALADREIERLFTIVRRLKAAGAGIIYISHRMEELSRIADRVTVMRDGKVVTTREARDFSSDEIVHAMVGRRLDAQLSRVYRAAARCAGSSRSAQFSAPRCRQWRELLGAGRRNRGACRAWSARAGPRSCARLRVPTRRTAAKSGSTAAVGRGPHRRGDFRRHRIHHGRPQSAGIGSRDDGARKRYAGTPRGTSSIAICSWTWLASGPQRCIWSMSCRSKHREPRSWCATSRAERSRRSCSRSGSSGTPRVFLFDEPTRGIDVGAKAGNLQAHARVSCPRCGDRNGFERSS